MTHSPTSGRLEALGSDSSSSSSFLVWSMVRNLETQTAAVRFRNRGVTGRAESHMISPSLPVGCMQWRSVDAGQTPQQSGGDNGNGSDRLDVHGDGRTDSRPAESEGGGVGLLRADHTTSDL